MSVIGMPYYADGFRLAGPPSECSLRSKARIDALFEDSRSICSSFYGGWYAGVSTVAMAHQEDIASTEEQRRVNSAVQARIEAMFASIEAESGTPGECAAAILPVKYMGAAPVGGRVASVRGLQEPLRQLVERIEGSVSAELEVSRRGLTFRTSDICEKINPFRRIAVWSSLRLHCKRAATGDLHHAFLPLVADNDQCQGAEDKHADLYRVMRGLKSDVEHYPPIFAVVMRRPGAARLLECHAFACETEEYAVAAAATLYRALLADLDANRRRPRQTNGLGCVSLASVASSVREQSPTERSVCLAPPPLPPSHPIRPPRVKKSSVCSSATEEDVPKITELQKAPRRKKKTSDIKAEDILEARGRRKDADVKHEGSDSKKICDTATSEEKENERRDVDNNTDRKNHFSKKVEDNKIYCQIEKNYNDDDGINGIYDRHSNKYEKLPCRSNKCSQEELISGKIYSVNGTDDIVSCREDDIYDKNHGSYDLHAKKTDDDDCDGKKSYSARVESLYDRIDKSSCRSQENSIYGAARRSIREKVYEERYKDLERIYNFSQEDLYNKKNETECNNRIRDSCDNVFFVKSSKNNLFGRSFNRLDSNVTQNKKCSKDGEKIYSSRRLRRVVTMDKPLKKNSNDSDSYASKILEYSQRVRKRSRAGSEPPVSRSEDAMKIRQATLKRSQSDVDMDRGDLLTRVALPRRGSFLNSSSAKRPNNIKGGTPLGFTELFDEFRNQEGLTSIDDILATIIDPEGMSFNDLKPLYKEFLLKLAATLTQDELYQRSASIMRRRRRPQRRRSSRRPCLLGRAIKRSVSRLKGGPTEFTSVIFPARRLNDSFGSSSSCEARNSHRSRVLASRLGRRRLSWRMNKHRQCHTTSEDSDTCRRLSRNAATANRSSSGYVSCSECSYDSESCTCISADKCYCSLSRRVPVQTVSGNTVVCGCDTDSCSESNKCYCARKPIQSTILEQLKQRGIVPSESTLSRGNSPDRVRSIKNNRNYGLSRNMGLSKSHRSPACGSSDNLALDYDLFSPGRSRESSSSEKVLVVSARDTQGRLVYVGGADRNKKCFPRGTERTGAHHEALSIKKSAEIAAIFGSDSNRISRRTSNASSIRSSISLEAGLGYLP